MWLELSVISYHRLSPRLKTVMRFESTGGTIGRSDQASWQLADPERIVSGLHAVVGSDASGFYIEDLSTNGLFINSASDLVGKGNRRYLKHNDTLILGDYELQVSALELQQAHSSTANQAVAEELAASPFAMAAVQSHSPSAQLGGVRLQEIDELAVVASEHGHDSQLDDFFHVQPLIPDDWSSDIEHEHTKQDAQPAFSAVDFPMPGSEDVTHKASSNAFSLSDQDKIKSFLKGLQLTPEQVTLLSQSEQSWQLLGEALRASLDGLMAMMRSRSKIKSALRVNQTTFQARENNPLKFSAGFDDVFQTLFANSNTGFLNPKQSVQSAFQDISKHEEAMVAASRASMQALLARVSPASIQGKDVGSGVLDKFSSLHAKARYWAMYELYHKELTEQLKSSQRGFSDDFIDAYEHSIKSVD